MIQDRFYKDPGDTIDFYIDWEDWLGSDTISTSTWTVPAGITKVSDTKTTLVAKIVVSGGTAGTSYLCVNEITTAGGLTKQETIEIVVQED